MHVGCAVGDCERPHQARGWCSRHYLRWRRTGDPTGSTKRSMEERYWQKVDREGPMPLKCPELGPCWIWTAAKSTSGHGSFNRGPDGGFWIRAHRLAYELIVGPIASGRELHHRCETPPCVNPAHLKPVTPLEHGLEHRAQTCLRGHDLAEHGYYRKDRTGGLAACRECRREKRRRP
jgi:HNH endonuclease